MNLDQVEKICSEFAEFILQYPALQVSHGDQGTKNKYRLNFPVGKDISIGELFDEYKRSIFIKQGYKCPDCGTPIDSPEGNIAMSEPIIEFHSGNYSWMELHECKKCDKLFIIINGT